MVNLENKKLSYYGSENNSADTEDPNVSKLLKTFKLDDLETLGETQSRLQHESEQLAEPADNG